MLVVAFNIINIIRFRGDSNTFCAYNSCAVDMKTVGGLRAVCYVFMLSEPEPELEPEPKL